MDDLTYLRRAYEVAEFSPDPSTQNGAVLVNHLGKIVAKGWNDFPIGVSSNRDRLERPLKYSYIEHAERNAIYRAAWAGICTRGLVMYCPWFACADCGRAIIQAGIKEVVGHALPAHDNNPRWKDSISIALDMFDEAGVELRYVMGHIGGVKIRMNGEIVEP